VLGALVLVLAPGPTVRAGDAAADDREIEAVAVRPRRRDRGIGRALVRGAARRTDGSLVASFDASVRPFYERLGFAIDAADGDRHRGRLTGAIRTGDRPDSPDRRR
jgi:GNAT superfamily N-acetyltransferase